MTSSVLADLIILIEMIRDFIKTYRDNKTFSQKKIAQHNHFLVHFLQIKDQKEKFITNQIINNKYVIMESVKFKNATMVHVKE